MESGGRVFVCSKCGRKSKSYVLYYSSILKIEAAKVERFLDQKQSYLERLERIPADLLTEQQHKTMQLIEAEIKAIVGVLMIVEKMGQAYCDETADMAEAYRTLWLENENAKLLIAELRRELSRSWAQEEFWIDMYQNHPKPTNSNRDEVSREEC